MVMTTPCLAHYGTTIMEAAPPAGTDQADVPITGALADTLEFLEIFGFEPLTRNLYPGMGRQYIFRRGEPGDADYIEKDSFTSYQARLRPATAGPRAGDTIFRLPHEEPTLVYRRWQEKGLAEPLSSEEERRFLAGEQAPLLLRGPDGQSYELAPVLPDAASNRRIYIWTADDRVEAVAGAYRKHFGLEPVGAENFHGMGTVRLLRRESPGVTVGLLFGGASVVEPRWTDDIFVEAGYSHFRLGALDMGRTRSDAREAFPAAGDVAYVHFEDSYLELVQAR